MCVDCAFCNLPRERILYRSSFAIVVRDSFPVSPGHTLIIPVRHVGSLFDASQDEQAALLESISWARNDLMATHGPGGFNIGINDGAVAGQTIPHLHVHVIPRYAGDQADPRGGVRWIFPERAAYWTR